MIRVQYLDHGAREQRSFTKHQNLCDCRFHCRKFIFCMLNLRDIYVFKIHVRAYFKQQLGVGISALIIFIGNNSKRFFSLYRNYKSTGILIGLESFTDGWIRKQCDLTDRFANVFVQLRTAQRLLSGRSIPTGWHLTLTPYTDFMGAVYCAFAVNFIILPSKRIRIYVVLYALVHYEKAVFIECSNVYIVTEPIG